MRIRRARMEDFNQIFKILRSTAELQGMGEGLEENLYSRAFVKEFIKDKKLNYALVAQDKDKLAGFLFAEIWKRKRYSYLADIAVLKEYRGKGIGKKLFKQYQRFCKTRDLKTIVALVQIENKGMHSFCEKNGLHRGNRFFYYEKALA